MLILAEAFKNVITAERMAASRTVEAGFNRGLDETFGNLNHAVKLSYAIDFEDTGSLTLFHKKVQDLMDENEHISYVAYFKEDTLDYIYPADKFRSLIGKNMADCTYSITCLLYTSFGKVIFPEFNHPHDAVERCTDLMRHLGQEIAFRPVCRLRTFLFHQKQLSVAFFTMAQQ